MNLKKLAALALAGAVMLGQAVAQTNPGQSPLSIAKGGTGASTADTARTSLGINATSITSLCNPFSSSTAGCVGASGGGTTNFLRADGTWAAPPGSGGSPANPTASVGLSAVNGSANTYLRSDGAPALSSGVQSALTGTNHGVALGTGAFGFGATAAGTSGYALLGNGGSADPTFQGFTQSGTGAVTRTWSSKLSEYLSLTDFGAVGDGVADDTTPLQNWYAAVIASHKPGYMPPGSYRATANLTWDFTSVATTGLTIFGSGISQSLIKFDAGFGLTVTSSSATDLFYGIYRDFGVTGAVSGPLVRFGDDALTKNFNVLDIYMRAANSSSNAAAIGVKLNSVLNSKIIIIANGNGTGTGLAALQLNQARFNWISGSAGNSLHSIHLTNGFNYGNVFNAFDSEVCTNGIRIDNSNSLQNTFVGGTLANLTNGINFTSGSSNMVMNPNVGGVTNTIASGGGVGLITIGTAAGFQPASTSLAGVARVRYQATSVNFNSANSDTTFTLNIPADYTRYQVHSVRIDHASASITTATFGLFTASGGGGTALFTGQAITVSTASENTNNNMQTSGFSNTNTQSFNAAQLFFRVQTAQGSAATADVSIDVTFLP